MPLGLGRRAAPHRLALAGAIVRGSVRRPIAAGTPAKHRAPRGQALSLLRLRHRLLLFLQRALDASNVIGVERGHMVVHFETERSDLGDEVLVGEPHLFRNLIDAHLRSGRPSSSSP
ncbi:MAG TPA: hypothetical protein VHT91_41900 [Kofleriaceae bacterium]|nr:hypothetical protein [Kofleriaceae bacterium]